MTAATANATIHDAELLTFVRGVAQLIGRTQGARARAYATIEAFVLAEGRRWTPAPPPPDLWLGVARHCYYNATLLARADPRRYVYVEGVATPASDIIPVAHAWVVERGSDRVVDPTWAGGLAYLGVPFRVEYLRAVLGRSDRCARFGLIDRWEEHWPLLTGAHPADEAVDPGPWPGDAR